MSKLTKAVYQKIYNILDKATPLKEDCGQTCGKLCCKQEDQNLGIYLLPGEEKMFEGREDWLVWEEQDSEDYDFPPSWTGKVYFIRCITDCPRTKRPIQCRTFPLAPHLTKEGKLILIRETLSLPYQCPLIKNKTPLELDFVLAVYHAWNILIQDPLIYDLVEYDSQEREEPVDIVYQSPVTGFINFKF